MLKQLEVTFKKWMVSKYEKMLLQYNALLLPI
jgi:hypothetical protein